MAVTPLHRPLQIVARPPPNLAVLLTHCRSSDSQKKNSKSYATGCQVLRLKAKKIDFRPDPAAGAYSAPPDLLNVLKGPTSKGSQGKRGRGREGEGTRPQKYFVLEPAGAGESNHTLHGTARRI